MKIADVKVPARIRKDMGDIEGLAKSIACHGLLHPIVVTEDGTLVCGERRLLAVKSLGLAEIAHRTLKVGDAVGAERDENMVRKDFEPREIHEISKHIETTEVKRGRPEKSKDFTDSEKGRATEKAAQATGVSHVTVHKINKVYESESKGEAFAKVAKDLDAGKISVHRAHQNVVNLERHEETKSKIEALSEPTGKYRCIVIDPPWPVSKINRDVRENQASELDYPVMALEEIERLPVADLADDGCHVYLWVTQKFLPDGLRLFESWGVKYQCVLTWVKPTGMTPYSWMYNTEHVLFGRIGSLDLLKNGIKLAFDAPVTGHSVKPDRFFEIVSQASPEPRLEMFARNKRDGFASWGSDV